MIKKILIELDAKTVLTYQSGSLFHGFLMEHIDRDYALYLHENNLKPFSQYIYYDSKQARLIWSISTLNEQAANYIITPLLNEVKHVELKKKNIEIPIISKTLYETDYGSLVDKYFSKEDISKYVSFSIKTPLSFKSDKRYIYYPNSKLIFQSLMNKWDASCSEYTLLDKDVLEFIADNTVVNKYNVVSKEFYLENVRIPGFTGEFSMRIDGNKEVRRIVHMLKEFSWYSGIGVKTSLGMGASV